LPEVVLKIFANVTDWRNDGAFFFQLIAAGLPVSKPGKIMA